MELFSIRIQRTFQLVSTFLRGFGSFIIKRRAEKTARNISKNTTIKIPAHNIPAFKPAKAFLNAVKENK